MAGVAQWPGRASSRRSGYGQVVAKAWQDEAFKQRVLSDPHSVLQEHGVQVPTGRQVRVVENTDQVVDLVLPQRPGDVPAEQLDEFTGGVHFYFGSYNSPGSS